MTTLILARHGETVWHDGNRYTGRTDVELTDTGRAQAERLGAWAADAELSAVCSSTLRRAVDTARPAAGRCGHQVEQHDDLVEVDFGRCEGLTMGEIRERHPEAAKAFLRAPAQAPFPGGESGTDAIARAIPALERIAGAHDGGRVLVVMHSTLMRLVLCEWLGIDSNRYRSVFPNVMNCARTTVELGPGRVGLKAFNVPV